MHRPGKHRRFRILSAEDKAAWQEEARKVKAFEVAPAEETAPPLQSMDLADESVTPLKKISQTQKRAALPPLSVGDFAGVDARTARSVKRGTRKIEATLDLHGMTRDVAHDALIASVQRLHKAGGRLLLVITGKGSRTAKGNTPLREELPRWLALPPLRPYILAVNPASAAHGGNGAYYVLLKRERHG